MLEYIIQGRLTMIPLIILSVLALAVAIDRAWAFYRNSKIDTRSLRSKVMELFERGQVEEAARLCAATPGPVSAVLLAGLQSYAKHKPLATRSGALTGVMEKSMDDYAQHAVAAVEKRFFILSTVGTSAPLLGMCGTVLGMIGAFGTIAEMKNIDPAAVGGDISEALITTAAGLIIALIAVLPLNYFQDRASEIELEIEEARAELLDFVATRVETGDNGAS